MGLDFRVQGSGFKLEGLGSRAVFNSFGGGDFLSAENECRFWARAARHFRPSGRKLGRDPPSQGPPQMLDQYACLVQVLGPLSLSHQGALNKTS